MYAYCRNEPVFRKDAFGTEDVCVTNTEDDDNPLNDYGKSPSGGGTGGGKGKSGKWVYEKAPYHNKGNSVKSPAPKNGQAALDNSVEISPNSNGRVGISEGEIVVLRPTSPGVYHGYVVQLEQLTPHMRRALFQAHMINKRGFIICG
jgi:filamentous hemagglutinin